MSDGRTSDDRPSDERPTAGGNPRRGFATRQIHTGGHPDPHTGSLSMPIFQTSTFVMRDAAHGADLFSHHAKGYVYTRLGNPNHVVVEEKVADLEGGEAAVATSSGMAAISAVLMTLLQAGDHVVAGQVLYGCTHSLLAQGLTRFGIATSFVDTTDLEAIRNAIRPDTRVVYLETPANPNLEITDIAVSLGDIESLIQHPASMTHASYGDDELAVSGISQGLVRLAVGLEDADDLTADLDQALRAAAQAPASAGVAARAT